MFITSNKSFSILIKRTGTKRNPRNRQKIQIILPKVILTNRWNSIDDFLSFTVPEWYWFFTIFNVKGKRKKLMASAYNQSTIPIFAIWTEGNSKTLFRIADVRNSLRSQSLQSLDLSAAFWYIMEDVRKFSNCMEKNTYKVAAFIHIWFSPHTPHTHT